MLETPSFNIGNSEFLALKLIPVKIGAFCSNDTHQTVGGNEANDGSSCRGCCHEEDTCSHNHHDLLLEILLIAHNIR